MSLWTTTHSGYRTRFHGGQKRGWQSERRIIVLLAGTQSGKTSWGPLWLKREIDRRGPGDYIAGTASYDLFKLKMLPALRETFEQVYGTGRYWSSDRIIELRPPDGSFWARRADDPMWGRIILRSAESGGGLESSSAKGAWLDEAGQDGFDLSIWEATLRRLSLAQGRCLLSTTIYNLGWLKTALYDRRGWQNGQRIPDGDPDIEVVQFDSIDNPQFPREEWERAKRTMPSWKFNMFYRGRYERPAGLIYDSFKDYAAVSGGHLVPRFIIPATWQRYMGLDFGGVNTAALFFAEEPGTKRLYLYREYKAGGRTARQHTEALLRDEPMVPFCVGGSRSEGQWRQEFRAAGLPVAEPDIREVAIGIGRVFGAHATDAIYVFDDLNGYLNEKRSYSRKLDAAGEPTEAIEDKSSFHFMDAERYIIGRLRKGI